MDMLIWLRLALGLGPTLVMSSTMHLLGAPFAALSRFQVR